jgi:hypothetical protein
MGTQNKECVRFIRMRVGQVKILNVKAEHINKEKSCFMVNKGAVMLDTSHGSAHHTIHNMLQFHAVWAVRQKTPKLKMCRCQPEAFLLIQNKR